MRMLRNKTLKPVKTHRLVPSVKKSEPVMRHNLGKLGDLACFLRLSTYDDLGSVETEDMQSPAFWFKVWDVQPLFGCPA